MMRGMTVLWAILAAGIGIGLFLLKYEVQAQEERLSQINRQIHEDQEAIHVLKAEWSYLNDPTRLREMAEKHLSMHSMRPAQIASLQAIPLDDRPAQDLSSKALAEIAPLPEPAKRPKSLRVPPPPAAAPVPAPAPAPVQEAPAAPPQLMVKTQPVPQAPSAPVPAAIPVTVAAPVVAAAKPVQPKPAAIPVAVVKAPAQPRPAIAAPKPAPQTPAYRPVETSYPAPAPVVQAAPAARPKPVLPPVAISSQTQAAPANSGYSRPYGVVGPGGYTAAPPAPMGGGNVLIIKSPALRDGEGDAR